MLPVWVVEEQKRIGLGANIACGFWTSTETSITGVYLNSSMLSGQYNEASEFYGSILSNCMIEGYATEPSAPVLPLFQPVQSSFLSLDSLPPPLLLSTFALAKAEAAPLEESRLDERRRKNRERMAARRRKERDAKAKLAEANNLAHDHANARRGEVYSISSGASLASSLDRPMTEEEKMADKRRRNRERMALKRKQQREEKTHQSHKQRTPSPSFEPICSDGLLCDRSAQSIPSVESAQTSSIYSLSPTNVEEAYVDSCSDSDS